MLHDVRVGVVDNGLYKGTGEYGGEVQVEFFSSRDEREADDGHLVGEYYVEDPTGSHGTMVCGLIGVDYNNGGMCGVGSVLGKKLTVAMLNNFAGRYGQSVEAKPDPKDPTIAQVGAKSYAFGNLVALAEQIKKGARVVNCSWGVDVEDVLKKYKAAAPADRQMIIDQVKQMAAGYKRFFEYMNKKHPEVLFVCAAGNDGWAPAGSGAWPAGLDLPNMITVGNVNNDGTKAPSSNMVRKTPGQEFEVTLAAPGREAVQGVDSQRNPVTVGTDIGRGVLAAEGGTSAAAPQVTAAAALLLSVNKDLTAAEIKELLVNTAKPGPAELGGKILAVDEAVRQIIDKEREKQGLLSLTIGEVERMNAIDAVATRQGDSDSWEVRAVFEPRSEQASTSVIIAARPGCDLPRPITKTVLAGGDTTALQIDWQDVTVSSPSPVKVSVTRVDSQAASVITLPGASGTTTSSADTWVTSTAELGPGGSGNDLLDLVNGTWTGDGIMQLRFDDQTGDGGVVGGGAEYDVPLSLTFEVSALNDNSRMCIVEYEFTGELPITLPYPADGIVEGTMSGTWEEAVLADIREWTADCSYGSYETGATGVVDRGDLSIQFDDWHSEWITVSFSRTIRLSESVSGGWRGLWEATLSGGTSLEK